MNELEQACAAFRALLEEQLARVERMKRETAKPEGKTVTVGLIDGDGIGPIIMAEARRVLERLLRQEIEAADA